MYNIFPATAFKRLTDRCKNTQAPDLKDHSQPTESLTDPPQPPMDAKEVLNAARETEPKKSVEEGLVREAVQILREKGYTWTEITHFLTTRGITICEAHVRYLSHSTTRKRRKPKLAEIHSPSDEFGTRFLSRSEVFEA